MSDLIGQDIGRYRIIEQLGRGGMATVYRAFDTRLEREVAIKFIRQEEFGSAYQEQLLKRFEREAKSLAQLSHPNIVKVHDYGEHNGSPYLVLEYLPGGTLKQRIGQPIPPDEAARLLLPVAQALAYAHRQGIIHRDVKPANILITHSGDPMLTDFGIAKILQPDSPVGQTALTGTGVGIGTPDYMAPEQWNNEVSPQTDIYALGTVFYELVTGQRPFAADTPAAVLLKQMQDPLPPPKSLVPNLPDEVEQILYKALAKMPAERYASMEKLAAALEMLSRPEQPATAYTRTTAAPKTATAAPAPSPLPTRHLPGWLWAIGGLMIAGIGIAGIAAIGLGALALMGGDDPTAPATAEKATPNVRLTPAQLPQVQPTATLTPPTFTAAPPPTATTTKPAATVAFQFCDIPCNQTGSQPSTVFPPTTEIYFAIYYADMPPGAEWNRRWSNGGQTWVTYEGCTWKKAAGAIYGYLREPKGLRAGEWAITVTTANQTYSGSFIVEGDNSYWDPVGTRACPD